MRGRMGGFLEEAVELVWEGRQDVGVRRARAGGRWGVGDGGLGLCVGTEDTRHRDQISRGVPELQGLLSVEWEPGHREGGGEEESWCQGGGGGKLAEREIPHEVLAGAQAICTNQIPSLRELRWIPELEGCPACG